MKSDQKSLLNKVSLKDTHLFSLLPAKSTEKRAASTLKCDSLEKTHTEYLQLLGKAHCKLNL